MTDLASSISKIQQEETEYLDTLGQELFQKIGKNINQLIDDASTPLLGEVKISVLDEETFQNRRGNGWVIMKGQDIAGSDYASTYQTLTGSTILPDARGLFMRTLDNGAGVDSGRTIASTQSGENESHRHPMSRFETDGLREGALKDFDDAGILDQAGTNGELNIFGSTLATTTYSKVGPDGADFRPKNIAVNYFIRINS